MHDSRHKTETRITAVLGPTNTGKTFLAVERMLGHATGMMGFPLRLLARENYDRVVAIKGKAAVALITGEEKIVPAKPRYFICTVESMPLDVAVDFLAVDEIQLCADPDRGHIFTDRLLYARGRSETMFLGAESAKPLIRKLVKGVTFDSRPRLSRLSYAGPRKITRLPSRTAVVAFSVGDVYAIAEQVRRHKGGAAVVMGALSPRTRNAQVELYQSGEVDVLVATDAIGMGLNMDVDHVCFAALRKFDGHRSRPLDAAEIAQIAGRAGRGMADGTFGPASDLGPLDPEIIERVENHFFPDLRGGFYRNRDLDFASIRALEESLDAPPPDPILLRPRFADDRRVLSALTADAVIADRAVGADMVSLLWEVCQIPDFRKVMAESHARLLHGLYLHLTDDNGHLPTDWVADQVTRLDRMDGDIDTLMGRIAGIRIWTYVSHRSAWLSDARGWQERTRSIEDRLSDALHDRLTNKFIDRRASVLLRKIDDKRGMIAAVSPKGEVLLDGISVGSMRGFRFVAEESDGMETAKAVGSAAGAALKAEVEQRVAALEADPEPKLVLDDDGSIQWDGALLGRVVAGANVLKPEVKVTAGDLLEGPAKDRVKVKVSAWLDGLIAKDLAPLKRIADTDLSAQARGIAFQLLEGLGQVHRGKVDKAFAALEEADRKSLTALGVRFGVETVYIPDLLKPAPQRLKAILWMAANEVPMPPIPTPGRVTVPYDEAMPVPFLEVLGYRMLGGIVVRADMLERFASEVRHLTKEGPAEMPPALLSILGIGAEQAKGMLADIHFDLDIAEEGGLTVTRRRKRREGPPKGKGRGPRPNHQGKGEGKGKGRPPVGAKKAEPKPKEVVIDENNPFAKLRELKFK